MIVGFVEGRCYTAQREVRKRLVLSRRSDEARFLRFSLLHPLMPLRAMPSITYRWAMRKTIRTGMLAITPPAMITA